MVIPNGYQPERMEENPHGKNHLHRTPRCRIRVRDAGRGIPEIPGMPGTGMPGTGVPVPAPTAARPGAQWGSTWQNHPSEWDDLESVKLLKQWCQRSETLGFDVAPLLKNSD